MGERSVTLSGNRGRFAWKSGRRSNQFFRCFGDVVGECLWHGIQIVETESLVFESAVRESLGATWVFPGVSRELARFLPCAHGPRNECWKDPPQTGGFPVSVAYSVGIHAVTDFSERQSAYHAASLEKSSCGVLQKPSFWLEMIEDIERSLNDCIGQREIPRRFGRGSGDGILRAGRRGPYEIVCVWRHLAP